ncbi:MAG: hypothetical protein J6U49_06935 [Alistipes sp.]|nr:hypothetical protein [Alistipes sp.]
MKHKILAALKTKYAKFGFSQKALDGVAENLEKTINDESKIEEAVNGLEPFFAVFQSEGDRSRSELNAIKAQLEEANKKLEAHDPNKGGKPDEEPDWFKAYKTQQEERYNALKGESDLLKAEKAKSERASLIARIAKELSIPEWRVKEGFVLAEEADEAAIRESLTTIRQNMVTAGLGSKGGNPLENKGEISKEEAGKIVEGMI